MCVIRSQAPCQSVPFHGQKSCIPVINNWKNKMMCARGLQTPGLGTGRAPAVPDSEWAKSWRRQASW